MNSDDWSITGQVSAKHGPSGPQHTGAQHEAEWTDPELEALRARIRFIEQMETMRVVESIPPGYVRCNACGKIVKNGRWLGTLHLCS